MSPTDAESLAPRRPTMAASINCITMADALAKMAGRLSWNVSNSCCLKDIGCPSRMSRNNMSLPGCDAIDSVSNDSLI